MTIENPQPENPRNKISFALDFNLGHLLVIFSLFLSAAGLYAHDEARLSVLESRVGVLDNANLGSRVSASEAKIGALTDRLDGIHDVLLQIRNELAESRKATVTVLNRVQTQQKKNSKAIDERVFP